ncbi:MAG: S8 family serine peptidase, partial [Sciscionella sp.]
MTEPERAGFRPGELYGSVIAVPLLERMQQEPDGAAAARPHRVVIDLHFDYPKGREEARQAVLDLIKEVVGAPDSPAGVDQEGVDEERNQRLSQYLVAWLTSPSLREVVRRDREAGQSGRGSAIYRIWPDFRTRALINRSAATVKADAARTAFSAIGTGIVWAVVDSGIAEKHPHFAAHQTLSVSAPLRPLDLTGGKSPLTDEFGHGTHVAGIIAGGLTETDERSLTAVRAELDHDNEVTYRPEKVTAMSGMAPACRLVSYKVLDDKGDGDVSAIIAALQDIQQVNSYGRDIKIHGVNLSVGYPFDPKWFACGQSPV